MQLHRRRDVHRFWANTRNWIGETEPTDDDDSADFHTGIVVDVYSPLKGSVPDPHTYARFISRLGEPALELRCRDGDPMLALRADGLDVEGLDSSADMLAKLQRAATDRGIDVTVHHSTIEQMDVGATFRSIFLAGPTFNLIVDDSTNSRALERSHLDPSGAALMPLLIPAPVPERHLGYVREHIYECGRRLRVTATSSERDQAVRLQTTVLRYEVIDGDDHQIVDRPRVLHSHTQSGCRELATTPGRMSSPCSLPTTHPRPRTPWSSPSCSAGRSDVEASAITLKR